MHMCLQDETRQGGQRHEIAVRPASPFVYHTRKIAEAIEQTEYYRYIGSLLDDLSCPGYYSIHNGSYNAFSAQYAHIFLRIYG
jgi:hypothetical protein